MLGDAVTYLSFPGDHQDNLIGFLVGNPGNPNLNHPFSTVYWEKHPKPLAPQAMRPFALHWRCHGLAPGWDF